MKITGKEKTKEKDIKKEEVNTLNNNFNMSSVVETVEET